MPDREPLIPAHGGYRKLKSFQVAQLAYDVTVRFCDRYIPPRSRTHDQMVQAARSGVQNIAEGGQAGGTSKKFELKLTSVARASLEELRLDYEDSFASAPSPSGPAPIPAAKPSSTANSPPRPRTSPKTAVSPNASTASAPTPGHFLPYPPSPLRPSRPPLRPKNNQP